MLQPHGDPSQELIPQPRFLKGSGTPDKKSGRWCVRQENVKKIFAEY